MDLLTGAIGFFATLLGVILAALALWREISTWMEERDRRRDHEIRSMITETLTEVGLIKSGVKHEMWPNGSTNLPDFLGTMWETTEAVQAGLFSLRGELGQR